MELGIRDRIALVTGGADGIGKETARLLAAEGARVVLTGPESEPLTAAAAELGAGVVATIPADLTDDTDTTRLREALQSGPGAPDIVVHTAGSTGATGDFLEIDTAAWNSALDINLLSAVRVARTFVPAMRERGWGRMIFLSSEDAEQPYPDELPYVAAKAGLSALMKGLSKQYSPDGVLINAVAPAFVESPMTDVMMSKKADEEGTSVDDAIRSFLAEERPGITARRRGRPEEVAAVIAFLCSERASYVTGSVYRVDSGSVATV